MKVFVAPVLNDFWLLFLWKTFIAVMTILLKSDIPVSMVRVFWKLRGRSVRERSITWWMIRGFKRCWFVNPIQYLYFRGCSRIGMVGGKKTPFPKICHTYPTTWYSYTLPKEDPKNMTLPLSSVCISGFSSDISKFYYIKKCRYRLRFGL